ncbi:glycoside hydrolase family 3 C-terminal domain-containing protein, partial [Robinsoniella sp.]
LWNRKVEGLAWDQDRISEAQIVAEHSDVVILAVGLDETLEGEEMDQGNHVGSGDKEDLKLPAVQMELIEKVLEIGKPTIVVLMAGSAIDLSYADEHADAILQAWYPGAGGGEAIADLLFGKISPSGKLPVTFYRDLEHMPGFEDYSMENRTYRYMEEDALYPFGYGLTYGNVEVEEAGFTIMPKKEQDFEVEVTLTNRGGTAVEEVVQLYIKDTKSALAVKNYSLCAFRRVALAAEETVKTKLKVQASALEAVDDEGRRVLDSNEFTLYVGISQPDRRSIQLMQSSPVELLIRL